MIALLEFVGQIVVNGDWLGRSIYSRIMLAVILLAVAFSIYAIWWRA